MEAVGRGDGPSLEVLVSRYHAQLLGFFFRMLAGDRATAEDLVQETFVKLLRQSTYSPDRAFRPWLFAVAANLARDHLRKASPAPIWPEVGVVARLRKGLTGDCGDWRRRTATRYPAVRRRRTGPPIYAAASCRRLRRGGSKALAARKSSVQLPLVPRRYGVVVEVPRISIATAV